MSDANTPTPIPKPKFGTKEWHALYPGTKNLGGRKKKMERLAKMKEQVLELRSAGKTVPEIAKELRVHTSKVNQILFNGVIRAERIQKFNEKLLSRSNAMFDVLDEAIRQKDKTVMMWWFEKTGIVSKEQVNLTINATNAVIPINEDMITAARMVVDQMRAAPPSRMLEVAPVSVVEEKEEPKTEEVNEHGNDGAGGEGGTPTL